MNQNELRLGVSLSENAVREILPEYFTKEYPVLIAFLEAYYEFAQEEGEFGNIIDDLNNVRDLSSTELQYLDLILQEIGLGISQDFFNNPREVAKSFAQFFRVKGTKFSYEGFFRAFYNSPAELSYPKENIFTIGDSNSIVGSESPKILQDSRIYQVLSVLLKTEESLAKWESLYKKYVHPAGIHLYHEMQIKDTNVVKTTGIYAELDVDNNYYIQDSATFKYRLNEPQIGKSPIGSSEEEMTLVYNNFTLDHVLEPNLMMLELQDSAIDSNAIKTLTVWGMSYDEYLDMGYLDSTQRVDNYNYEMDVHIAPVDLGISAKMLQEDCDIALLDNTRSTTVFHDSDINGPFFVISVPNISIYDYHSVDASTNCKVGTAPLTETVNDIIKPLTYSKIAYLHDNHFPTLSLNNMAFIGRGDYSSFGNTGSIRLYLAKSGLDLLSDGISAYPSYLDDTFVTPGTIFRGAPANVYYARSFPQGDPVYSVYDLPDYGSAKSYNISLSLPSILGKTRQQLIDENYEVYVERMYYAGYRQNSSAYFQTYINNSTMAGPRRIDVPSTNPSNTNQADTGFPITKINLEELTSDNIIATFGFGDDTTMRYSWYIQQNNYYYRYVARVRFALVAKRKKIWDMVKYDSANYDAIFDLGHNMSGRDIPLTELNNETVFGIKDLLL